ncbi:hypothetical protein NpNSSI1_00008404 [Neofusicoccum parvum]|nr:hypothetical protein NpNSSI1_00008404 [Neofusicoccum parvum]
MSSGGGHYPPVDGWYRSHAVTNTGQYYNPPASSAPGTSAPSTSGGTSTSGGPRTSMGAYDAYTAGSGGGITATSGGPPAPGSGYVPNFGGHGPYDPRDTRPL